MTKRSSNSTPWEYKLVSMGNPLGPGTEARANALGRHGWELVSIDAGVWIFKRPLTDEATTGLQAFLDETVPLTETEVVPAVGTPHERPVGGGATIG